MSNKYLIGVDIGGTTIKMGLFSENVKLIKKWVIDTDKSVNAKNNIFRDIENSCNNILNELNINIDDVLGVGIGIPGPITNSCNLVAKCANLNLEPMNIAEQFNFPKHIKIIVENDANFATLGEYISGSGNLCSNLILITIGTGIGAGIISNGKLVSGVNGAAGEIGHIKLPCTYLDELSSNSFIELEKLVSGISLSSLAKKFIGLDKYKESILNKIEPSTKNIFENQDDELCKKLINIMATYIGLGLSYSCSTTNPKKVIIGGGVSAAKGLIEKIQNKFNEFASYFVSKDVQFLKASLGNDAGIYGAASSILFANFDDTYIDILSIVGTYNINTNIFGKDITTMKTGGKIKYYVTPENINQLSTLIDYLSTSGIKYFIIGNGSNIIIDDNGYDGVVISLSKLDKRLEVESDSIYASSNITLREISIFAMENSLSGLEFSHGIPGTLGGGLYMNAGAYDGELKDVVEYVDILDVSNNKILRLQNSEINFEYRNSKLKKESLIVIGSKMKLNKSDKNIIKAKMDDLWEKRTSKQPLNYPSAGSIFKRPEGNFAGKLISDSNLKGYSVGGAKVSEKHAGFIINYDNATTSDITTLINIIQNNVKKNFDIELKTEVIFIK